MATLISLLSHSSVISNCKGNPMLSFQYPMTTGNNDTDLVSFRGVSKRVPKSKTQSLHVECVQHRCAMSTGGNYSGLNSDDNYHDGPFWLDFFKDTVRALKLLAAFLVNQPGQLKYIEWPSFQDTLRTATLTLVLVTMLIVALSSVDAALSFVLALLLRRPA